MYNRLNFENKLENELITDWANKSYFKTSISVWSHIGDFEFRTQTANYLIEIVV